MSARTGSAGAATAPEALYLGCGERVWLPRAHGSVTDAGSQRRQIRATRLTTRMLDPQARRSKRVDSESRANGARRWVRLRLGSSCSSEEVPAPDVHMGQTLHDLRRQTIGDSEYSIENAA